VPWPPSLALLQGNDPRTPEPSTPTSPGGGGGGGGTGASGAVSGAVYCEEVRGMYAEEEVLRRSKEHILKSPLDIAALHSTQIYLLSI
jgi:hypothetical protein